MRHLNHCIVLCLSISCCHFACLDSEQWPLNLLTQICQQVASEVLPEVLPKVVSTPEADLGEGNWEDILLSPSTVSQINDDNENTANAERRRGSASPCSSQSPSEASVLGCGRLSELRWLVWPNAPIEIERLIALQCPKVHLNPMPQSVHQAVSRAAQSGNVDSCSTFSKDSSSLGSSVLMTTAHRTQVDTVGHPSSAVPSAGCCSVQRWDPLDPMCPLDDPVAAAAGPRAWEGLQSGASSATPLAMDGGSLAAKFRQAFVDRAWGLRERASRAAEVLRRRQLRRDTALRALEAWMDEA